jgi:hypothetical protein
MPTRIRHRRPLIGAAVAVCAAGALVLSDGAHPGQAHPGARAATGLRPGLPVLSPADRRALRRENADEARRLADRLTATATYRPAELSAYAASNASTP